MIVLEGQEPLGDDAHAFYDEMVKKLEPTPSTCSTCRTSGAIRSPPPGAQSNDGKAAYVQVKLRGNQGEALANESVEAVQHIVDEPAAAARASRPMSPVPPRWRPTSTSPATAACR